MRLNRFLARAGVASRRKSDSIIMSGRVAVNGEKVEELGIEVDEEKDFITLNGTQVSIPSTFRYLVLNKPVKVLSAVTDDRGRRTVLDLIDNPAGIHPVGRLDYDTSGVLLLTNDGELTHELTHPSFGVERVYIVELNIPFQKDHLDEIRRGVIIDDRRANVINVDWKGGNEVKLVLAEGRNREVRKIFEQLGYEVKMLHRESFAEISNEGLPPGEFRDLTVREVERLKGLD